MYQKEETTPDIISIVSEPGALTFITRKDWQRLPEALLGELTSYVMVMVFNGSGSIHFLLRSMIPTEALKETGNLFKLVKISIDEETGKQIFFYMNLTKAEADQLIRNQLTLWE